MNLSDGDGFDGSANKKRPWQFSLDNLLQLTAAVAVVTAVLTQIVGWSLNVWLLMIFAATFAVPVPVLAWALLTPRCLGLRTAIAVVVSGIAASRWLFWWPWEPAGVAGFCIGQFVLIGLALVAVRISGYRFCGNRRFRTMTNLPAKRAPNAKTANTHAAGSGTATGNRGCVAFADA